MRVLRISLALVAFAVGPGLMAGCAASADDASTPAVSMPPPKEPVAGVGESGAGTAEGPSTLKGPSND